MCMLSAALFTQADDKCFDMVRLMRPFLGQPALVRQITGFGQLLTFGFQLCPQQNNWYALMQPWQV